VLHARDEASATRAGALVGEAFTLTDAPVESPELILDLILGELRTTANGG